MEIVNWQEHEPELRADWEAKFGQTGLDWEEIREAHHFGWRVALLPEFVDMDFVDAEPDLANHWYRPENATEEMAWDYVREAAREGWRQARQRLGQRSVNE